VILVHIQRNQIFVDRKLLVVVHMLIEEGKQSDMQMVYIGLRRQHAVRHVPNNWWEVCYLAGGVWQLILFFWLRIQQARFVCAHGPRNAPHWRLEVNSPALSILIVLMRFSRKLARNWMIWAISFAKAWFRVDSKHMWLHLIEVSIRTIKYLNAPIGGG
jgi:hypothetical protein